MSTCNRCGTQFNSPFCPNCGTPAQFQMQPPPPPAPPQQMPHQQMPQQMPPMPLPPNQLPPYRPLPPNQLPPYRPLPPNQLPPYGPMQPYQYAPRKNHSVLLVILTLFGVFMFLSILGFLTSPEEDTDTPTSNQIKTSDSIDPTIAPTPTEIPYIKVTSTDLIAIYNNNQVKCKKLYDKKLLEVTGTVVSIGIDILDETYVCLGSDNEFVFIGIQCYAKNDDEVNKIAELKEGDVITVRGKGDCGSFSFSIDKAEIIK